MKDFKKVINDLKAVKANNVAIANVRNVNVTDMTTWQRVSLTLNIPVKGYIADDEGNPLGGIYKAINFTQKVVSTPIGVFHMAGNKIKEALHIDDIKSDAGTFSDTVKTIKDYASDGDLTSIWKTDASFSDDDPVKTFFNVGITINKIFSSYSNSFKRFLKFLILNLFKLCDN